MRSYCFYSSKPNVLRRRRNLLPEHCYDWLDYKPICGKARPAHRSGVEGESTDSQSPGRHSRASRRAGFRAITRGRATSGDQLLDWLVSAPGFELLETSG